MMMEENSQPSYIVHLQAAGEQEPRPALVAEFRFAPDRPEVGQPGKDPGDLFLVQGAAGGPLGDFTEAGQAREMLREQVQSAPGALSEEERQVLELRFGLVDGKNHTVEEVSRYFNVTRERIQQIEASALRKLRLPTRPAYAALVVSLGKAGSFSPEMARRAGGGLGKWLVENGAREVGIDMDGVPASGAPPDDVRAALLEGLKLGAYRFKRYKNTNSSPDGGVREITVTVYSGAGTQANQALVSKVEAVTGAVILARDLSHEPANVINPVSLAGRARQIAEQNGLTFRVLDERELAGIGAGAILAVGQGSLTPPRMIILEYPGDGSGADPVVLVGKAITFDTGGYSIKSVEGIVGMKYDKCGGVDVLAILQAAAALKLPTPVVGIIAAAENMISGKSYRPDDIITTLSGKTVEIISTDAEGRLVLADALTYAQRAYHPRAIIDLATLTGGVVVALGRVRAGLLSNNDALAGRLFQAGEKTGERLWRLPLDVDYSENMKGEDADLKNSGGREGHAILGGAFLKAFVSDAFPWAHLDIAGVADTNKEQPYSSKGATGFGVRLIVEFLENGF